MRRFIFLTLLFVLGSSQLYAARWEERSYRSPGLRGQGHYGFAMFKGAREECLRDEEVVVDALVNAASQVRIRCEIRDAVDRNGATWERVYILGGTFRVLVE